MKIIFYGWERGMNPIQFYLMLKNKAHITLEHARKISLDIRNGDVPR